MEDNYLTFEEQILEILEKASPKELQKELSNFHPSDIAEVFEELEDEQRRFILISLNSHILAEIFEHLDEDLAAKYMKWLDNEKAAHILENMDPDDAADILGELNSEEASQVLEVMEQKSADILKELSKYQEDTAGSVMTTDYIELKKTMDVKEAMKVLIANAKSTEAIQRLFVVDENNFLEGIIELKTLIQARSPITIEEIMLTDVITAKENQDAENVARLIQNYGIYLLPVVNDQNQMLGVITMDDAADILDLESDEDYARFATVSSDKDVNESIWRSALHRLPWLILLLFLGLIISSIISRFEDTIAKITILVFFQPLILGMAGNTGTQSLAVTVRGISKEYFMQKGNALKHIIKELKVGMMNGFGIGVISFITTSIFLTIAQPSAFDGAPMLVAMTVGLSAFIALSSASAFGAFFPILLTKINIDPAVASGPFITTLNDIIGLLIYFSLATLIFL